MTRHSGWSKTEGDAAVTCVWGWIVGGRVCVCCFLYRDPTRMRVEWDWRLEKKRKENSDIRKNTLEDVVAA